MDRGRINEVDLLKVDPHKVRKAHAMMKCPLAKNSRYILDFLMEMDCKMSSGRIERMINKRDTPYLPQSCVSMTLNRLLKAGYLNVEPIGSMRWYTVNWDHIEKVNRIAKLLNARPDKSEVV